MTYNPSSFMNPEILEQIRELDRRGREDESLVESLAVKQYEATLAVVDAARTVARAGGMGTKMLRAAIDRLDQLEGGAL